MKHELNSIWESYEGIKKVWKLQAEKGIMTFDRKRDAITWQTAFKNIKIMQKIMDSEKS